MARLSFKEREVDLLFFLDCFSFPWGRLCLGFSHRIALEGEIGKDVCTSYRHSWSDHKHLAQPDTAVISVVGSRHNQVNTNTLLLKFWVTVSLTLVFLLQICLNTFTSKITNFYRTAKMVGIYYTIQEGVEIKLHPVKGEI